MLLWPGNRGFRNSSCVLLRQSGTLGSQFSTGARLAPSMLRICKAPQSGGTDEQPPKVRRRLTRVTSTASAISVASSVFDEDDNTPSTVAHKTIYHSVLASYSTSHRSTSAVYTFGSFGCNIRFAAVPTTHEIPKGSSGRRRVLRVP